MSTRAPAAAIKAFELMRAGRHGEALPFARQAVAEEALCTPAHGMLATLLLNLGEVEEAAAVVDAAQALDTASPDACDGLAYVAMQLGRHEQANALYRRATQIAPGEQRFWYNLASSERGQGRLDVAEEACNRSIAIDPGHWPSYLLRSELRVRTAEANHVDQLRGLLTRPNIDDGARMFLGYALAKELDDLADYDQAFSWFAQGAAARRRNLSYDVALDEQKMLRIGEAFGDVTPWAPASQPAPDIFIIGLPRSGTTLLERLMLGLPRVATNGETDNFARALLKAAPAGPQDIFARAAAADPNAVAAGYAAAAHRPAGTSLIEKLPMNYLYIGAISRALPDAALLVVTRSPIDSCFAMFRTLFGQGYPFSYDFDDLARYYAAYDRLMKHWRSLLGDAIHEVAYADLVGRTSEAGARAAAHCGLEWRDEAIDIAESRPASFTASASQIRRPIYSSSVDRWRHYRRHLQPLIDALDRHGVAIPDQA